MLIPESGESLVYYLIRVVPLGSLVDEATSSHYFFASSRNMWIACFSLFALTKLYAKKAAVFERGKILPPNST